MTLLGGRTVFSLKINLIKNTKKLNWHLAIKMLKTIENQYGKNLETY